MIGRTWENLRTTVILGTAGLRVSSVGLCVEFLLLVEAVPSELAFYGIKF